MRIKGVNLQALNLMTQDDIIPIIGKRRAGVEVRHSAVRRGQHRIDRFPVPIPLQAAYVQALVHLPTLGPDASEGAAGPWLAYRPNEEFLFLPSLEQSPVCGRQMKRLSRRARTAEKRQ